jgi:hypothetical protein
MDQDCGCPLGCDVSDSPSYCKYVCQRTADCANSGEYCFANGAATLYCNINYCNLFWAACNAESTGDGTCMPEPYSTQGVCFQAGSAGIGSSCDYSYSRVDAGPLCVPGALCLPGTSGAGSCVTGCDPTLDAGPCQANEACAALVGTPSHPTSAHLGYCAPALTGTDGGGMDGGGLLLPQVADNGGFGVVAIPDLVTISFENYPYGVQSYGDWIVDSQWLNTVGADYGVSNGGTHVDMVIAGTAPTSVTDDDIRSLLTSWIVDGGVPAPNASTIYLVYYPDTTTITAIGGTSCQYGGFGGYHEMFLLDGGAPVIYGVIATCPNTSGFGPTEADGVALAASHEFMEAATDPDSASSNGSDRTWAFSDYSQPWAFSFGEVGDPCTGAPTTENSDGGSFLAQRIWSNTAAANGFESPCIPIPSGEVYFTVYTNPAPTQVVAQSANDQSVTYTLVPWSSGPVVGGWNLFAGATVYDSVTGTAGGTVTFTQADGGSGTQLAGVYVGAPLSMTVDVPAGTSSQSLIQVQLYSYTDITFNHYNIWPAAIVVE